MNTPDYQAGDIVHVIEQDRSPGQEVIEWMQLLAIDNGVYVVDTQIVIYHSLPAVPDSRRREQRYVLLSAFHDHVSRGILYRGLVSYALIDNVLQPFDWTTMRTVVDYAGMMVAKKYASNDQLSIDQTWGEMIDGCDSLMSGNMQGVIDHNIELLGGGDEEDDDDYATCNCVECDEPGDINDMASTPCGPIHEGCLSDHCLQCDVCRAEFSEELEAKDEDDEDDETDDAYLLR